MAEGALGIIDGQRDMKASEGLWLFDEDDWLLLAMLADPVYCAEMLFENPLNHDHGGCYTVLDYQYPLFRPASNYATFPCARSVGKTESIKARSVSHAFRRIGEDMLLTAPELIHLQPLTEAIEHRITSTRLTKDFLKKENQRTGIVKTPAFQVDFSDGTRIVGRIPKVTGPQPVTAKVLTPYGWTTMGELEPGDEVIGSDGSPIGVLGTMTPWESDVYELEFSDGSSTQADAHHLWSVRNDAQTIWRLRDTAEMMADLGGPAKHYGGSLNMWRVPAPPVVQYAPTHIRPPLDPYLVGVLLGDGSISGNGARLICHDQEIIDRVTSRLPSGCSLTVVSGRAGNYQIVGSDRHQANPVLDGLRSLGLMGKRAREKEIPDCYRFGTPTDRLELLRGLLDTDGAAKNGSAHLILASQPMIEQAAEIARSLGGWASVGQETIRAPGTLMAKGEEFDFGGGTYYRTTIRTHDVPFSLTRKAQKYNKGGRHRHRSVRAIKRIGKAKVCCIKVAADDGLYLTDQLIVTHNTGVKGMHEPDMIMDESQDYPDRGFTELHETVMKDHMNGTGEYDFTYHLYGVHAAGQGGRFATLAASGDFEVTAITAIMKPGWNKKEKAAAAAMYGGTNSPDYRRNILGEPGTGSSQFFVTSRLMACVDQNTESQYNQAEFVAQELQAEEVDKLIGDPRDVGKLLDLPDGLGQIVYAGMDVGLVNDPTVIQIWALRPDPQKRVRLKLVRQFHLWRFREKQIRRCTYRIARHYGLTLRGFGQDITGLGLPLYQAMEDDEAECPDHLREVARGYVFNAKIPVAIDPEFVSKQGGELVDQYGHIVEERTNPFTGAVELLTRMTMIEASTRYLRKFVDETFLLLPFRPALVKDMQGETEQRVRAMGSPHLRKKPNAFHELDAMRAMAMSYMSAQTEEMAHQAQPGPILDKALDFTGEGVLSRGGFELDPSGGVG